MVSSIVGWVVEGGGNICTGGGMKQSLEAGGRGCWSWGRGWGQKPVWIRPGGSAGDRGGGGESEDKVDKVQGGFFSSSYFCSLVSPREEGQFSARPMRKHLRRNNPIRFSLDFLDCRDTQDRQSC